MHTLCLDPVALACYQVLMYAISPPTDRQAPHLPHFVAHAVFSHHSPSQGSGLLQVAAGPARDIILAKYQLLSDTPLEGRAHVGLSVDFGVQGGLGGVLVSVGCGVLIGQLRRQGPLRSGGVGGAC